MPELPSGKAMVFFIIRFTDPPTVYFGVLENKNKIAFTYFFYSRRLP